jgi:hypothetical protein
VTDGGPPRPRRPIDPGLPGERPPGERGGTGPFSPGDRSELDPRAVLRQVARTRRAIEKAQLELTRMASGPGPDGTEPRVVVDDRASGRWPWLLIRTLPGDVGARPLPPTMITPIEVGRRNSPDILLVPAGPPDEPPVVDRQAFPALKARALEDISWTERYDVWVHVWNLGRTPAFGVRVRVRLANAPAWPGIPSPFLGGRQLDLGDQLSPTAHLVVKVASYRPGDYWRNENVLIATAECASDPATGDLAAGQDRHSAWRVVTILGQP